ncbi:MAG: hypothetical protein EOO24_33010, partial [Comamonadaceae bacterium]
MSVEAVLDRQVQRLALAGSGAPCMRTLLLTVADPGRAREFIGSLLADGLLAFGPRGTARGLDGLASIGFTSAGLRALGAPAPLLATLRDRSPAYAQGAVPRAARFLGDAGESAAERWDAAFDARRVHAWVAVHAGDPATLDAAVARMRGLRGAAQGFDGWTPSGDLPDGRRLRDPDDPEASRVHFGFRDAITRPSILDGDGRLPPQGPGGGADRPRPGELLLGYPDNDGADLWTAGDDVAAEVADLLR